MSGLAAVVDVGRLGRLGDGGVDLRSFAGGLSVAAATVGPACSLSLAPGPVEIALDRDIAVEAGARGSILTDFGAIDVAAGVDDVGAVDALAERGYDRRPHHDGRELYVTRRRRRARVVAVEDGTVVVGTGPRSETIRGDVSAVVAAAGGEATDEVGAQPTGGVEPQTGDTRWLVESLLGERAAGDGSSPERDGSAEAATETYLAVERFDGGPSGMDDAIAGAGEALTVVDDTNYLTSVVLFESTTRRRRSSLLRGATDRLASVPGVSALPTDAVPSVEASGRVVVRRATVDAHRFLEPANR